MGSAVARKVDEGGHVLKILVVEDSLESQSLISIALSNDYELEFAGTMKSALEKLQGESYSAVLIDLGLPDGDGFDLYRRIQSFEKQKNSPIFFLTANKEVSAISKGLSLGADDYITKPVDPVELLARIDSRVQKRLRSTMDEGVLRRPPFELDRERFQARLVRPGQEVETLGLTPIEFRLLLKLIQSGDRVLTRENLIESVWGPRHHIEGRSIDKHISSLRNKLGEFRDCVKTRFGLGYSFEAPLKAVEPESEGGIRTEVPVAPEVVQYIPGFLESRQSDLREMRSSLESGDFQRISRICHMIRGVASPFGFATLERLVSQLGAAANAGKKTEMSSLIEEIEEYLGKYGGVQRTHRPVDLPAAREYSN